jgi:hypothetical protein
MTSLASFRSNILPCTGLVVPPLLWAINTQLGEILPYAECGAPLKWAALTSFPAAVLSLAAGLLSWRLTRHDRIDPALQTTVYPASFVFVGGLGALSGTIFAFALLLQGLASLVLTGCER